MNYPFRYMEEEAGLIPEAVKEFSHFKSGSIRLTQTVILWWFWWRQRDICGWISQICVRETSWMLLLPSWGSSVMRWIDDYPFLSTNVEICLWLFIYTKRVAEQRVSKERTGPLQTIAFFFAVSWDSFLLVLPLHISVDVLNNNLFVCVSHSNAYGVQKYIMMRF